MLTIHPAHEFDVHEIDPRSGQRVDDGARHGARSKRGAHPVCSGCLDRPAVTRIRGRHVALGDHDLCRQCWRTHMDRARATRLARRTLPGRSR
jgi:hypothetical protein